MFESVIQAIPDSIKSSALIRFALVGGAGFMVDLSVFSLVLHVFEPPLLLARAVAFVFAATATWWGNRTFTFSSAEKGLFREWLSFFTTACISSVPNFLVFSLIASLLSVGSYAPYIALISGVMAGMLFNFVLCNKWVFRGNRSR